MRYPRKAELWLHHCGPNEQRSGPNKRSEIFYKYTLFFYFVFQEFVQRNELREEPEMHSFAM